MKIIDKRGKKDYYDYLSGIWGVDPKLVLDRREFENVELFGATHIVLYICGKRLAGFYDGESYYFGESLAKFGDIKEKSRYSFSWSRYERKKEPSRYVSFDFKEDYHTTNYTIDVDVTNDLEGHNIKENCPILINIGYKGNTKFPILEKMGVAAIFPPEVIYQMLVDWLSERNSEMENRVDNRTDVEKLLSKGFDKKQSFRPKIKM